MTHHAQIGLIILAGGLSRRFGDGNKLCKSLAGQPLICHTIESFLHADIATAYVITGYQEQQVKAALSAYPVNFLHNPDYQSGMASAITTAVNTLTPSIHHLMIALGDMPFIEPHDIKGLIETHLATPAPDQAITRAYFNATPGHPVLWGSAYFKRLSALTGDEGARGLIKTLSTQITPYEMSSAACITDYDTIHDFKSHLVIK